ncbi:MAG: carbonic anhydrase [Gemmatimonadota bacterium]
MRFLPQLFANNREWAEARVHEDPDFFSRLSRQQSPRFLWIGCSDSRVPANQIVGLDPGEVFVHRNVANVVRPGDLNLESVLQYAVATLQVTDVIVCGHYGCGGVQAALDAQPLAGPIDQWLEPIRAVRDAHAGELGTLAEPGARWRRLCELNVLAQVDAVAATPWVTEAWEADRTLHVHGWIYDVRDGLLHDLDAGLRGPDDRPNLTQG